MRIFMSMLVALHAKLHVSKGQCEECKIFYFKATSLSKHRPCVWMQII